MKSFLKGDYEAVIFEIDGKVIAYMRWKRRYDSKSTPNRVDHLTPLCSAGDLLGSAAYLYIFDKILISALDR